MPVGGLDERNVPGRALGLLLNLQERCQAGRIKESDVVQVERYVATTGLDCLGDGDDDGRRVAHVPLAAQGEQRDLAADNFAFDAAGRARTLHRPSLLWGSDRTQGTRGIAIP